MRCPGSLVTRSFSASVSPRSTPHSAPVLPPVVATSRPTAQFTRHHDVVDAAAFRQGWRVCSRLDSLLEAGRIDQEAWDCAHEWRRWAETVTPLRAQRWDVRVDVSAVPNDTGMLIRTTAATDCVTWPSPWASCVSASWKPYWCGICPSQELGRLLRLSHKTAREWAAEDRGAGRAVRAGPPVIYFATPIPKKPSICPSAPAGAACCGRVSPRGYRLRSCTRRLPGRC